MGYCERELWVLRFRSEKWKHVAGGEGTETGGLDSISGKLGTHE